MLDLRSRLADKYTLDCPLQAMLLTLFASLRLYRATWQGAFLDRLITPQYSAPALPAYKCWM